MTDEPAQLELPEKPERQVIPIEDLDKIEKLLDVAVNTLNMPNLAAIKQSCMEELKVINDGLAAQQAEAEKEYQEALAQWERDCAKAKKDWEEAQKQPEAEAA